MWQQLAKTIKKPQRQQAILEFENRTMLTVAELRHEARRMQDQCLVAAERHSAPE